MIEDRKSYGEEYIRVRKNYYRAMALAEEINQQSIKKGYRFLNYEKVIFKRREVIQGEISMVVPESFTVNDEKLMKVKYPKLNYPNYSYMDEDEEVYLTYSLFKNFVGNVDEISKQVMEQIVIMYSGALLAEGVLEVEDNGIHYFSFMIPDMNEAWFQMMYFIELGDYLLVGGFGCGEYDQKEWTPAFIEMLETIAVV